MTRKNKVLFREFLNTLEDGGTAYVKFEVHYRRNKVSAFFAIKDCVNEATLEFYISGAKDTTNVRTKVAILKKAIIEFEKAYLTALDKHEARLASRKAKKK